MERIYIVTSKHPFLLPTVSLHLVSADKFYYKIWYKLYNTILSENFTLETVQLWAKHGYITSIDIETMKAEAPLIYIIKHVCSVVGISPSSLSSITRLEDIVKSRQLVMYYAKKLTVYSNKAIGEFVRPNSPLSHSTVIHGRKTIRNLKTSDKKIATYIAKLDKIFNL